MSYTVHIAETFTQIFHDESYGISAQTGKAARNIPASELAKMPIKNPSIYGITLM